MSTHQDYMAALTHEPPGGISTLQYREGLIRRPTAQDGEVLIKVAYASIIAPELYWPIYQKKDGAYCEHVIPSHDFSGTVVNCPSGEFRSGEEVFAFTATFDHQSGMRKYQGAAATFALADVGSVLRIPGNLGLREAASVPLSALTAWQGFHEHLEIRPDMHILVNGASGPSGLWFVQVGKHLGAHVTATAGTAESSNVLKSLPCPPDQIVNYRKDGLAHLGQMFDVVVDMIGGDQVIEDLIKVAKPGASMLSICDPAIGAKTEKSGIHASFYIVHMDLDQLKIISRLIEEGTFKPIVDSVWPLAKGVEAWEFAGGGHAHGRIILDYTEASKHGH